MYHRVHKWVNQSPDLSLSLWTQVVSRLVSSLGTRPLVRTRRTEPNGIFVFFWIYMGSTESICGPLQLSATVNEDLPALRDRLRPLARPTV